MSFFPKLPASHVLHIDNFRWMVLGRLGLSMALMAQGVVVGWQVYSITKDPFMLGLIGLAEAAPALCCALFAGHIVDISRPLRVFFVCTIILTINTFLLLLIAGDFFSIADHWILTGLFIGTVISGIGRSFAMPAGFALVPQIVERPQLAAASATLSSAFQFARIASPALAGIIYAATGPMGGWLLVVICGCFALVGLSFVHLPHIQIPKPKTEPAWHSIKQGWLYIMRHKVLLPVMTVDMFAVLFGGATAMLPAYADQVLNVGAVGLGALRAAPAVGAMTVAIILALRPMQRIHVRHLLYVVTGWGVCMIGFGFSTVFLLSLLFLVISGAFDSVSVVIRSTLMQLLTPDTMRGRVSSVNSMFIISSNEIGAFQSGVAAKLMGLVPSVVFGGFASLLVVAVTALLSPKLLHTVVDSDGHRVEKT